jgi:adenylate kinase family enzyme
MKPKLIILNGPLGIGKSTLANRYAEDHPLTLNLDIDNVWAMLSNWREEKEVSTPLSKKIAIAMARAVLEEGHDVVVPQIVQTIELADSLQKLAEEVGANYFEILLSVDKANAIDRFIQRGRNQGNPTGFRAGGIIDTSGREDKLSEMYDNMMKVVKQRPQTIVIKPELDNVEQTYSNILLAIDSSTELAPQG